ncbi:hypothetical protein LIER_09977 [Lithospermum erythrorhizon]|uniref:Uncharacterized protein n=1 Tax=Lithospermum erythrorhizon TaxID=34254 RepID=A0AAV3PKL1_LITER
MADFIGEMTALLTRLLQMQQNPTPSASSPDPNPKPTKNTYAALLSKPNDVNQYTSDLPSPIQRGETTVIRLEPEIHQQQLNFNKTNLIGRLMLRTYRIQTDETG